MLKKLLFSAFLLISLNQTANAIVGDVVGAAGELTAGAVETAGDVAVGAVETAADVTDAALGFYGPNGYYYYYDYPYGDYDYGRPFHRRYYSYY